MPVVKIISLAVICICIFFMIKTIYDVRTEVPDSEHKKAQESFVDHFKNPLESMKETFETFGNSINEKLNTISEKYKDPDYKKFDTLSTFDLDAKLTPGTETFVDSIIKEANERANNDTTVESYTSPVKKTKRKKYIESFKPIDSIKMINPNADITDQHKAIPLISDAVMTSMFAPTAFNALEHTMLKTIARRTAPVLTMLKPYRQNIDDNIEFVKLYNTPSFEDYCKYIHNSSTDIFNGELYTKYCSDISTLEDSERVLAVINLIKSKEEEKAVLEKFTDSNKVEPPNIVELYKDSVSSLNNVLTSYNENINKSLTKLEDLVKDKSTRPK